MKPRTCMATVFAIAAMIAVVAGGAQASDRRIIKFGNQPIPDANAEAFLQHLTNFLYEERDALFERDDLYAALVDLNGDGVKELVVQPRGWFCTSSSGSCRTSVFRLVGTNWIFAGTFIMQVGGVLEIENESHNGWPILLSDRGYRMCWVKSLRKKPGDYLDTLDEVGYEARDGMSGYFRSVAADLPCPPD